MPKLKYFILLGLFLLASCATKIQPSAKPENSGLVLDKTKVTVLFHGNVTVGDYNEKTDKYKKIYDGDNVYPDCTNGTITPFMSFVDSNNKKLFLAQIEPGDIGCSEVTFNYPLNGEELTGSSGYFMSNFNAKAGEFIYIGYYNADYLHDSDSAAHTYIDDKYDDAIKALKANYPTNKEIPEKRIPQAEYFCSE